MPTVTADDQRALPKSGCASKQDDEHDGHADRLDHAEQFSSCTLVFVADQIARDVDDEQQLHRFDGLESCRSRGESSGARR